ncbi:hypothetical protein [Paracoccus sanguinis]|uniref:hypothetical protein n=1 Tax=Paracoccus sanguinis TaxID=1545044 RepID=UPI00051FCF1A|nr:hypothetical protein [Paracoccus sanguinis]KGJ10833.1 hypothetical protein IX54_16060 [Paracoccus sanguinis]
MTLCMTPREAFCDAIRIMRDFPSPEAESELYRLCGKVWTDNARMPSDDRWDVRDQIGDKDKADEWEARGMTFAGAAQRIRPRLRIDQLAA